MIFEVKSGLLMLSPEPNTWTAKSKHWIVAGSRPVIAKWQFTYGQKLPHFAGILHGHGPKIRLSSCHGVCSDGGGQTKWPLHWTMLGDVSRNKIGACLRRQQSVVGCCGLGCFFALPSLPTIQMYACTYIPRFYMQTQEFDREPCLIRPKPNHWVLGSEFLA